MANSIRIKSVPVAGGVEVRALINHPMSLGQRDKASGKFTNAHYVEEVVVALNGKTIVQGDLSSGIASNPYLMFKVRGAMPGDKLRLSWKDNKGGSDSHEITLS
jgi:sulfur-oxidizing protein SoxZ